jgi:hypothetical protein
VALGAAVIGATRPAAADDPPRPAAAPTSAIAPSATRARELYDAAERADADRLYADAALAYEGAIAADPRAAFAGHARARLADLRAHAEGGFAPLARLDEVRRDPTKRADRAAIEALARDLEAFPPGRVRSEARLVVADAWWHALGDPRRAVGPLRAVIDDADAERRTRTLALSELVSLDRALGDPGAALEDVRAHADLAPKLFADLARAARRVRLRLASIGVAVALAAIGAASLARAIRRARDPRRVADVVLRPWAIAVALGIAGAGALAVRLAGGAATRPLLLLGPTLAAVDVAVRSWRLASGDERPVARAARAVLHVAGAAAIAFLILDATAPSVLERLGL